MIQNEPRFIVWDPMRQFCLFFPDATVVTKPVALLAAVKLGAPRIVYVPRRLTDFDAFAACCMLFGAGVALVDELASVSQPGKASGWWGRVVRESRHIGLQLVGISQRAAEIDKTLMSNATDYYVFKLKRRKDREAMAEELDIDRAILDSLPQYEFIHMDDNERVTRGRLRLEK